MIAAAGVLLALGVGAIVVLHQKGGVTVGKVGA